MSNIGLTEAECEELRMEREQSGRYRLSDGKWLKGYKVFPDGSFEIPAPGLRHTFHMIAADLNIDLDKYVYDCSTNRLVKRPGLPL